MIKSFFYLPGDGVKTIDGIADFDRLTSQENCVLWVDLPVSADSKKRVWRRKSLRPW